MSSAVVVIIIVVVVVVGGGGGGGGGNSQNERYYCFVTSVTKLFPRVSISDFTYLPPILADSYM